MFDKSCKSVLVRGVNWIGDSIMTLPALKALKKGMPRAKLSLLVKQWVSPVFEGSPDVDEIIIYADKHAGLIGKIRLSRLLSKRHFCSAVLFQNAFDAALVTFLAGIRERAGYKRDGRSLLLTAAVPIPLNEKKVHQIYYYLNLVRQLGIEAEYSAPYIYIGLNERLRARDLLKNLNRPVLGINPGATYGSAKRWLPERFADVANWHIKDTHGSVVIFGSEREIGLADGIYKKMLPEFRTPESVTSLAGKTSVRELIPFISECEVFVTNDSGPMHIAYAVGTPLVAIFGSTDPQLTGPPPETNGKGHMVIRPDVPCSPCFERTCKNNDMQCMHAITSDDVYYGVKSVLPFRPAVFFDRDGTLCKDKGYINKMEDFQILEGIKAVSSLKEKGFKIIGVTNQSGIARGIVDESFVRNVDTIFIDRYGFDDFYYCPHHPDEHCPCRKPEPGMVLTARLRHKIDLKKSYIVGDKEADMLLAKTVGAKAVLVLTGEANGSDHADFVAKGLAEAVDFILNDDGHFEGKAHTS
jgi:heptosyltransferase-2